MCPHTRKAAWPLQPFDRGNYAVGRATVLALRERRSLSGCATASFMNRAIARALAVLELLSCEQDELGVREVAARARIPPAAAQRILATLYHSGFVRKSAGGRYAMSTKILQLAENLLERMELPRVASRVLREIRDACNETVSLFVIDDAQRVCVASEQSTQGIRRVLPVGTSLPLWAGASGKLLLAFLTHEEQEKLLARMPLKPLTSHTITNAQVLKSELQRIRKQGYAMSIGERVPEAAAIATPVHDAKGSVVGAFTISSPRERCTGPREALLLQLAIDGAKQLSEQLGYQPTAVASSSQLR